MTLSYFTYRSLKKIADILGFNLEFARKKKNISYETIIPAATYAPWILDTAFNEAYKTVKNVTQVDLYRCYELWELVEQSIKLNGALLEVGVWRGGSGALIAKKAKILGLKDTVYLCDTFKGVVKVGSIDSWYKGGEYADTSAKIVEDLCRNLKLDKTRILSGIFPDETAKFIKSKIFRFCHIDVDTYNSARDTLDWVWPKLVVGGIIVFDDYGFYGHDGIVKYINELRNQKDRVVIHNLNGHAIVIKLK